jgi:hypothetical protein
MLHVSNAAAVQEQTEADEGEATCDDNGETKTRFK